MKLSVKKGDYVKIIAGSDKGKTAQIIAVDRTNGRVTVEGKDVGQVKKAVKARKASDKSGIINMPKTVDASNVMPICASCGKEARVPFQPREDRPVYCSECFAKMREE